jgi:hypothetical protein
MSYRYVKLPNLPHSGGMLLEIKLPHSVLQSKINQIEVVRVCIITNKFGC